MKFYLVEDTFEVDLTPYLGPYVVRLWLQLPDNDTEQWLVHAFPWYSLQVEKVYRELSVHYLPTIKEFAEKLSSLPDLNCVQVIHAVPGSMPPVKVGLMLYLVPFTDDPVTKDPDARD